MNNFESKLISERESFLKKIIDIFRHSAIECHTFGSTARGDSDAYSDIDVWLTFKDEDIKKIIKNRFEYFSKIGEIIHLCEAPQNSPVEGKYSCILFKTQYGILHVDFYLCPLSTSFITKESKKIFGNINLSEKEIGLNPQKVLVDKNYRIDFFIIFIFIAIKKLARKSESPLANVLKEYSYLQERYGIKIKPLNKTEESFNTLKTIISNVIEVSNEKQKFSLLKIISFLEQVENN